MSGIRPLHGRRFHECLAEEGKGRQCGSAWGRWSRPEDSIRPVPPHPSPLPWGEGDIGSARDSESPHNPPPRSEEAMCVSSTKGVTELFPLLGERVRVRGKRAREDRVVRPITQCPGSERWMGEEFMNAWQRKERAGSAERRRERGAVLRTPFVPFPLTPALSLGERVTSIRPVIPSLPYCPPPRSEEARCVSSTKGVTELFPLLGERVIIFRCDPNAFRQRRKSVPRSGGKGFRPA
jgi:hypothetical protein